MLKRLFRISDNASGSTNGGLTAVAAGEDRQPRGLPDLDSPGTVQAGAFQKPIGFEQIYQAAAVKPPRAAYSILQVAEMINSPHLAGMTPEAKRGALFMALEAARMDPDQLLQDAVLRQRALNDYDDSLQERLRGFEAAKGDENRIIQTELDRLTSQHVAGIQANLDAVAHAQDEFQTWQKRKQRECERISEAAGFCVPQGGASGVNGLATVLEQASRARR